MSKLFHRWATLLMIGTSSFICIITFYGKEEVKKSTVSECNLSSASEIKYDEAGIMDKTSRWRKLDSKTYVFSAYIDDRKPCSAILTVLGFGFEDEPPLYGTLRLRNSLTLSLRNFAHRTRLNPFGKYREDKLGPYSYSWPSHVNQNLGDLKEAQSIIVQQGKTKAEIPIKMPVFSQKQFGVCLGSPLFKFGQFDPRILIDYIEINKILGAEWFTFYNYMADQRSIQILEQYTKEDIAEVVLHWGNDLPRTLVHYHGQELSINECAYRNMHRVKYLVYADLDEFIVPRDSLTWASMMLTIDDPVFGSFAFHHVYFRQSEKHKNETMSFFNISRNITIPQPRFLTHNLRSRSTYTNRKRSKCIIKPLYTGPVGVHEVFMHRDIFTYPYTVPPDRGLLHHYRHFSSYPDEIREERCLIDKYTARYSQQILDVIKKRISLIKPSGNLNVVK